jgi:hypothetical protein
MRKTLLALLALTAPALAQTPTPASVPMPGQPTTTTTTSTTESTTDGSTTESKTTTASADAEVKESAPPPEEDDKSKKEPKRGDSNAGGQIRLPNGPGDDGKYATFNWVALDAKGRYYLLK